MTTPLCIFCTSDSTHCISIRWDVMAYDRPGDTRAHGDTRGAETTHVARNHTRCAELTHVAEMTEMRRHVTRAGTVQEA